MGLKSNKEMLEFGIEFANKCYELEEKLDFFMGYDEALLAYGNCAVSLSDLVGCSGVEEAEEYVGNLDVSVKDRTDSEYVDGQILCEGTMYETLYYYEDMGSGGEDAKETYHELAGVLEKFGFNMDLSGGGSITLQTYENLMLEEKAMDEQ
jgi:hypothetical protein